MTHLRVIQALNDGEVLARGERLLSFFGIHADNITPDDDGIDSLLNAAEDYGYLAVEGGGDWLLTRPLLVSKKNGTTLTTERFPNPDMPGLRTPCFRWAGDEGQPMLLFDRCLDARLFEGWTLATDDPARIRPAAGFGILLDGGQDTNPDEPTVFGSSCILSNLRHLTFPDPIGTPPTGPVTFIAIAERTKWNQEYHRIIGCGGNANGHGASFLRIGPNSNSKDILLADSRYITGYQHAVEMANGSLVLERNNFNNNEWNLWLGAGDASVGYVTEYRNYSGEASRHHAMINMPFYSWGGTYDTAYVHPRTRLMADPKFPKGSSEYRDYEECYFFFGSDCTEATIHHATLSTMVNPDAKVFGFQNNGAFSRIELGPFHLGPHHTLRTLGLDADTLATVAGTPKILFHDRAHDTNPGGPGVQGLECGEFAFNDRGRVHARNAQLSEIEPSALEVADGAPAWAKIARGQTVFYRPAPAVKDNVMFRHVDTDGRRKQGILGAES